MLYVIDIEVEPTKLMRTKDEIDESLPTFTSDWTYGKWGPTSGHAARNRWDSVKADQGSVWHILFHAVDWYWDWKDWSVLWTSGDLPARPPHREANREQSPSQIYDHIGSILSSKYDTKNLQLVEHGKVWSNWSKEEFPWIHLGKGTRTCSPAGVGNRSLVEKVGGNFVRV